MDFVESIKHIQGILSNYGKRLVIDSDGIRASDCNENGAHSATTYTPESLASSFQIDVAQEWNGTGLPPAGCECEFKRHEHNEHAWHKCYVVGLTLDGGQFVIHDLECDDLHFSWVTGGSIEFRHIRTETEKQREADKKLLLEIIRDKVTTNKALEAILDAGFTRKSDEQKPQ